MNIFGIRFFMSDEEKCKQMIGKVYKPANSFCDSYFTLGRAVKVKNGYVTCESRTENSKWRRLSLSCREFLAMFDGEEIKNYRGDEG